MDAGVCIAALVPPPRTHRHRYFGVLAPNALPRAAVTAMAQAGEGLDGEPEWVPATQIAPELESELESGYQVDQRISW